MAELAEQIRAALNARDMDAFRGLIAEGARWGEGGPDDDRTCHDRNEIIATYERLLATGVRGTVVDATCGRRGIACTLEVEWPAAAANRRGPTIYQAFFVSDGLITRIAGYDDHDDAVAAISH